VDTESHLELGVVDASLDFFDGDSHAEGDLDDVVGFLELISVLLVQETEHDVGVTDGVEFIELGLIWFAGLIDIEDELVEFGVKGTEGLNDNGGVFVVGEFSETLDIGVQHCDVVELVDNLLGTFRISEEGISGLGNETI
jgi:hypothetical protein